MSTWQVNRVRPGWGVANPPGMVYENRIASTAALQRGGVTLENRLYAPVVDEGQLYRTSPGDRIRIRQQVVNGDGSVDTVIRDAVDTGQPAPQFIQRDTEQYGITDDERAQGDEQRAQWNAQVQEQNLANNYSAPYVAPAENAPYYSPVDNYDAGYVESAPVYTPQQTYTPQSYTPDVYVPVYTPPAPDPEPELNMYQAAFVQAAVNLFGVIAGLHNAAVSNGSETEALG